MMRRPPIPSSQRVYGRIIYGLTVAACLICILGPLIGMLRPDQNVLNPYHLFAGIFEGQSPTEVWRASGGDFPGGHFYRRHPLTGDGLTQFGLALVGCSSAAWALMATAVCFARARDRLFAGLCLFVSLLIFLAMSGLLS